MKRKLATWPAWQRLLVRRFAMTMLEGPVFTGPISLLTIDKMLNPPAWIDLPGGRRRFADNGSMLLQHFPRGERHVITTSFDADGQVAHWYIDIVVLPDGTRHLLDADELDQALAVGTITQEDWTLAWDEANRLLAALERGPLPVMTACFAHLALLRALPM